MKAIFDAIRRSKSLRARDEGYCLQEFERRNRGHQNELDTLALELTTKPRYTYTPDSAYRTRMYTLEETAQALLRNLARYVPAALQREPDWADVLDAPDGTGLLTRCFKQMLNDWCLFDLYRQVGDVRADLTVIEADANSLKLTLTCSSGARGRLKATRALAVPVDNLNTLRGCLDCYERAQKALLTLLVNSSTWEEFSPERQRQQFEQDLQAKLKPLLRANFTPEEILWLRQHPEALSI